MDVVINAGTGHRHTAERVRNILIPLGTEVSSEHLKIEHDRELNEIRVLVVADGDPECIYSNLAEPLTHRHLEEFMYRNHPGAGRL